MIIKIWEQPKKLNDVLVSCPCTKRQVTERQKRFLKEMEKLPPIGCYRRRLCPCEVHFDSDFETNRPNEISASAVARTVPANVEKWRMLWKLETKNSMGL